MGEIPPAVAQIAAGPRPSDFLGQATPGCPAQTDGATAAAVASGGGAGGEAATAAQPFDPLRLCIFATVAMLGWLFGPVAVVVFAGVGFAGYWQARRAGLTRSKCYLRDTRLVLAYLGIFLAAGVWGIVVFVQHWLGA